jgi:hypothetical protein
MLLIAGLRLQFPSILETCHETLNFDFSTYGGGHSARCGMLDVAWQSFFRYSVEQHDDAAMSRTHGHEWQS